MSLLSIFMAVLYREIVWFKRFISEYAVMWIIPLLFSFGVVFLPATMSGIDVVCRRMGELFGTELSLRDALVLSVSLSSVISLVAVIVNDTVQTVYNEAKVIGVLQTILEATSMRSYYLAIALVRTPFMALASTLYLAPTLTLIAGLEGFVTYLLLLVPLILSSFALAFYSLAIALPITFYTNISRPWIVPNTLVPALLAGSGLYIPVTLVPMVLRAIAYTSPVPLLCQALQVVVLYGYPSRMVQIALVITILLTVYLSISQGIAYLSDAKARRGG